MPTASPGAELARQRFDDRTARLAEQTQARDASRLEVSRARAELVALRREAGCETDDALPAVEERSARRQRLGEGASRHQHDVLEALVRPRPLNPSSPTPSVPTPPASNHRSPRLDERVSGA